MTNEEIYENVMGHKPNKEFGVKGSFSWNDINSLMNAVKNYSIHDVRQSEQLKAYTRWLRQNDHLNSAPYPSLLTQYLKSL